MQAGSDGELVGVCVVAERAVEVVGVAARLRQSWTIKAGWLKEDLREA